MQLTVINLDENVGVTNDSRFGTLQLMEEWLQFYQPASVFRSSYATNESVSGRSILNLVLQQNFVYKQYTRNLTSVVDVLTDLGGMFSSLSLIGLAFNLTFSYNLLLSSLIRKLYHFRPRFPSEVKKKKGKGNKDKDKIKTMADEIEEEESKSYMTSQQ